MKIFISHSTRDRWIASRVSDDLEELGIETFLDEKDISTGESIDGAIYEHLQDADEILMLLSPAALESHWVLLEIGGAKALGKLLIPIMVHIGPNELPQPLRAGLARDINDIDRYFSEVQERAASPEAGPPPPSRRPRETTSAVRRHFASGDLVKIAERPQGAYITPNGTSVSWEPGMTVHAGKTARVIFVDDDRTVELDVDDGEWWWAMDWLEPVDPVD